MSERVSSVEIEDVLSSIRRLVSRELRPMQQVNASAAVSAAQVARGLEYEDEPEVAPISVSRPAETENRLVLTASLRVAPRNADGENAEGVAALAGSPVPAAPALDASLAETVAAHSPEVAPEATISADIWQDAESWEESWEQEGEDRLAEVSWAAAEAPTAPAASSEDDEPADALPPTPGHRFSFSVARSAFDEEEAELEEADDAAGVTSVDVTSVDTTSVDDAALVDAAYEETAHEEAEVDGAVEDKLELTPDLAVSAGWAQPADGGHAPLRAEPVAPAAGSRPEVDPHLADAAAAEAIRHAIASVGGETGADPARAGSRASAEAEAPAERPTAQVSYLRRADEPSGAAASSQGGALSDPDEAPEELILEEAALREIIREVVREELAGSLGGRITRNVRKLVRGEIAQMLASRPLE